jgi:adenylyltransferase/sulfurtransferase
MDSGLTVDGSLPATSLTQAEILHYSRQLILPELGLEGQRKLKRSRVLVVGAGGLGSPVLIYLAAAGIGTLGIVEDDQVDHSNLHRQILFGVSSIGLPKIKAARAPSRHKPACDRQPACDASHGGERAGHY